MRPLFPPRTNWSGKSSIINLIPRFYEPTAGRITIDGLDTRQVTLNSLRDQIGIVLQETTLFAASVRENIAFGCPGASEEDCERLFERLYRLEASRNRNSGGSGLGLAICRNIVEAHGGQIRAEPGPLGGLLVTTTLPLVP